MEKILDQEEINELFSSGRLASEAEAAPGASQRIFACVFGPSSRLTKQQVHLISVVHETFTRRLATRLGSLLHTPTEARLVSVEELPYSHFLARIPKVTYWASISLVPHEAIAALNLDLSLAFPLMDLLLGGDGKVEAEPREVTEIEERVLETVGTIICQEFDATWQSFADMKFIFGQRQNQMQILRLLPPEEKILALGFEVRLPWACGMLNFAFPAAAASTLLRKITERWITQRGGKPSDGAGSLHRLAEGFIFDVEMTLNMRRIRAREVLGLKNGQVLNLGHRVKDPVPLAVAGKKMFQARPIRVGNQRAGLIENQLNSK
ncbi:MAG: flagellar motor switch protein FliM [Terriglobia bacterium]